MFSTVTGKLADARDVLRKVKAQKPDVTLVWTLHDHWSHRALRLHRRLRGWKSGCQNFNNYPPVRGWIRAHQRWRQTSALSGHAAAGLPVLFHRASTWPRPLTAFTARGAARLLTTVSVWRPAILAQLSPVPLNPGKPQCHCGA